MTRTGKSRQLTFCTVCEQEVGVWETPFNRTQHAAFKSVIKVSAHGAPRCSGSLMAISPNVAWPNPKARAA